MSRDDQGLWTELAELQRTLAARLDDDTVRRMLQRKRGIELKLYPDDLHGLPWAWPFSFLPGRGGRCSARLERNRSGRWGRCELSRHPRDIDHALEYGMHAVRWRSWIMG